MDAHVCCHNIQSVCRLGAPAVRVSAVELVRYAKQSAGMRERSLMLRDEPSVGVWVNYIKSVVLPKYRRAKRAPCANMSMSELGLAATQLRDYCRRADAQV